MKWIKKLSFTLLLLIIAGMLLFSNNPFSNPEIIVLEHMTELNNGRVEQICLVKSPPSTSKELYQLIDDFNERNPTKNGDFSRLFIKEHDYIFFPALTLRENINYTSENFARNDLDNIDFLAKSYSLISNNGERIESTEVYVGEIWYYKK